MASSSSTGKRKREEEESEQGPSSSKWRTNRAQEAYSSKLIHALRLVRAAAGTTTSSTRGRDVRDAADRALAAAARGRSRWSRAILARRRRRTTLLRARLHHPVPIPMAGCSSSNSSSNSSHQHHQEEVEKAKMLGRLVPGCRKLPFPALLAEVSDYIAALEMQVRAMTALAQALATTSSSPS
ncbi:hypothetical protein PR202_ga28727 [Eleusine coracana subsp. coracana]|uniref:IBH1-like N-terminal domain-containing protein n=1 Tax=Eleusine coracana subsp. coracana TaxID=191504 RepID=A0AAV5DHV7_ELECO|nr:hypothetical protein QOZ80_7AG0582490 [Eleusine coracana subsp. coracana]GJN10619.1 hypothetical protein PR202_ga28727 [Eleusine coracana subsp. coracana]